VQREARNRHRRGPLFSGGQVILGKKRGGIDLLFVAKREKDGKIGSPISRVIKRAPERAKICRSVDLISRKEGEEKKISLSRFALFCEKRKSLDHEEKKGR